MNQLSYWLPASLLVVPLGRLLSPVASRCSSVPMTKICQDPTRVPGFCNNSRFGSTLWKVTGLAFAKMGPGFDGGLEIKMEGIRHCSRGVRFRHGRCDEVR